MLLHVDLPREFFGGVPIHSGEGVSASPMIYVLLSGQDDAGVVHHYLVDAGFHAEKWIHRFGFYDWESPEVVLGKVGVRPEEIEKVFLTHMHFDHANNVGALPNADVYVQWEEYQGWLRGVCRCPICTHRSASRAGSPRPSTGTTRGSSGSSLATIGCKFVGDGDELLPGGGTGTCHKDGHTFGTQWIFGGDTSGGRYVVCRGRGHVVLERRGDVAERLHERQHVQHAHDVRTDHEHLSRRARPDRAGA